MVTPLHRAGRALTLACALLLLCQCETQRTVKSTRSSISFDQAAWGGQAGHDASKIRTRFAEKGYSIGEDGSIQSDRPDLYSDRSAREGRKGFGTKEARFKKSEARTKEFRTPEYVQRQQFRGAEESRDSGAGAREGAFAAWRDRSASKRFGSESATSASLASYGTTTHAATGRSFATGSDREGSAALSASPRADGIQQQAGYQSNAGLSVDDVKKMLNPGGYARSARIGE